MLQHRHSRDSSHTQTGAHGQVSGEESGLQLGLVPDMKGSAVDPWSWCIRGSKRGLQQLLCCNLPLKRAASPMPGCVPCCKDRGW